MIKLPTVFILGAGASAPYGYPTGNELLEKVLELKDEPDFLEKFDEAFPPTSFGSPNSFGEFTTFIEELEKSGVSSIDQYTASKDQYLDFCKFSISYLLISNFIKNPNCLTEDYGNNVQPQDWYRFLLNECLLEDAENDPQILLGNCISFLTFNYDFSLEIFLWNAINARFDHKTAMDFFKKIRIIHLHGALLNLTGNTNELVSNIFTAEQIKKRSQSIRFVHETPTKEILDSSQTLINESNLTFFLGFGFHGKNMDKLDIDWAAKNKYLASSYDFTDGQKRKIYNKMTAKMLKTNKMYLNADHYLNFESGNCLNLIKNHADLLSTFRRQ